MNYDVFAPWHKQSYDRFLNESLPQLLAERLPLADYSAEPAGDYSCRVQVTLGSAGREAKLTFQLPACDEQGIFQMDGQRRVVLPAASCEELDKAEIKCVGEQLFDEVAGRLGQAQPDLPWDEPLARAWLPLDEWVRGFLTPEHRPWPYRPEPVQLLDDTNWLSRATHLRRVHIPDRQAVVAPGQLGRVCPFETPEGTNIGRVLSIARGAEIRDGRLVVTDDSPAGALGLSASMIPFLAHCDPNRLLMGANMMRQCVVPDEPEPALVQTGSEPDAPEFWCGRNLLTAFTSWGGDTFDDGIVVSESAAARLDFPDRLRVGDKLASRQASKGTIARILPDEHMPHLPDGTAVELLYCFTGLHTRLNFGQLREAVMGRIAHAAGEPAIVPPFAEPSADELRARLREAGLAESGMETLTDGRGGKPLDRPSAVGWIYWGKLHHLVGEKVHASVGLHKCNLQGFMEYYGLRDAGAFETIAETFNLRSVDHPDAETLAARVAAGPVGQAGPPAPKFADLTRRLAAAGIRAELAGEKLSFRFAPPQGQTLKLACPVPHPWLPEQRLDEIGTCPELEGRRDIAEANDRMSRILADGAPASLKDKALAQLEKAVGGFFDALLEGEHVRFRNRVMFSGRTIISPGPELNADQLGLAEEIAWTLFGPLVARKLGGQDKLQARSKKATAALDEIMAESWVILNRAPTTGPRSLLAFHPVRIPERSIRLPLLACWLLNADFDGDQAAVFLPVTEPGQREAGEKLSIAAHLRRDPHVVESLALYNAAGWGLAELSRTPPGLAEISELLGHEVQAPEGFVTRSSLAADLAKTLAREGPERTVEAARALLGRGLDAARRSGASLNPFVGESLERPPAGEIADEQAWSAYQAQVLERIASRQDYDSDDLGAQLLSVKSGARGRPEHLVCLLAGRCGLDEAERPFYVTRGMCQGLRPRELFAVAAHARRALGELAVELASAGRARLESQVTKGFNVLARAMRSDRPGIVFAQAAAIGETDPLTDLDSRLFVGLPPK